MWIDYFDRDRLDISGPTKPGSTETKVLTDLELILRLLEQQREKTQIILEANNSLRYRLRAVKRTWISVCGVLTIAVGLLLFYG